MSFDVFAPPGYLTSRGSELSIDSDGQLYVRHGSRTVTVAFSPLQWQLIVVALTKLLRPEPGGAVVIESEGPRGGKVRFAKERLGLVLEAEDRSRRVRIALTTNEAGDLREAARRRATQQDKETV